MEKCTYRSKVGKWYLKVQGMQRVPSGPGFPTSVTEEEKKKKDKLGF